MSRYLLPAAVLALCPAGASAQLPFYFGSPPGAFRGYQAVAPVPFAPSAATLIGPGAGLIGPYARPYFGTTVYGGAFGNMTGYPVAYPTYYSGYYPYLGAPYTAPAPVTIVIQPPAAPAAPPAVNPAAVPIVPSAPDPAPPLSLREVAAPATLTLQFPAAAKVWHDGRAVPGATAERTLTSPALLPGERYTFKVRAEWTADGKSFTYARDYTLAGGEQSRVLVLSGAAAREE